MQVCVLRRIRPNCLVRGQNAVTRDDRVRSKEATDLRLAPAVGEHIVLPGVLGETRTPYPPCVRPLSAIVFNNAKSTRLFVAISVASFG